MGLCSKCVNQAKVEFEYGRVFRYCEAFNIPLSPVEDAINCTQYENSHAPHMIDKYAARHAMYMGLDDVPIINEEDRHHRQAGFVKEEDDDVPKGRVSE